MEELAKQYLQHMIDYEDEDFFKLFEDRFEEEIFNWGQNRYDEAQCNNQRSKP